MKYFVPIAIVMMCLSLFAGSADAKDHTLWGKQTEGWGATNAKTDGNSVTLTGTATITKVEQGSKGYCIWSQGRSVLCGGGNRGSIVGKTLGAGTYTVLPTAGTQVTIHMTEA